MVGVMSQTWEQDHWAQWGQDRECAERARARSSVRPSLAAPRWVSWTYSRSGQFRIAMAPSESDHGTWDVWGIHTSSNEYVPTITRRNISPDEARAWAVRCRDDLRPVTTPDAVPPPPCPPQPHQHLSSQATASQRDIHNREHLRQQERRAALSRSAIVAPVQPIRRPHANPLSAWSLVCAIAAWVVAYLGKVQIESTLERSGNVTALQLRAWGFAELACAVLGVVLGHIALRRSRTYLKGKGLAIAGLVVGWIITGLWLFGFLSGLSS